MSLSNPRNQLQDGTEAGLVGDEVLVTPPAVSCSEESPPSKEPTPSTTSPLHPQITSPSENISSFTPFPEGEGATNPDIPSEPMLNNLYNRVLDFPFTKNPPFQQQNKH